MEEEIKRIISKLLRRNLPKCIRNDPSILMDIIAILLLIIIHFGDDYLSIKSKYNSYGSFVGEYNIDFNSYKEIIGDELTIEFDEFTSREFFPHFTISGNRTNLTIAKFSLNEIRQIRSGEFLYTVMLKELLTSEDTAATVEIYRMQTE
jgi:hypothetical protein